MPIAAAWSKPLTAAGTTCNGSWHGPQSFWWRWTSWSLEWSSHPPSWEAWHSPNWWYGCFVPHGPWVLMDAHLSMSLSSWTWWTWPTLTKSCPSSVPSLESWTSSLSPICKSSDRLCKESSTPHLPCPSLHVCYNAMTVVHSGATSHTNPLHRSLLPPGTSSESSFS